MTDKNKQEVVVDRRIQKTKRHLSEALIALILEKGYEAVTIQDIIDKANVGRSTFYAHYENKEQLFVEGHKNLGKSLFESDATIPKDPTKIDLNFLTLFQHAAESHSLAKALLGRKGGDILTTHFRDIISKKITTHLNNQPSTSKAEQKMLFYTAEAVASAVIRLLVCWLDDDMPFTPEEMAGRSNEILEAVFRKLGLTQSAPPSVAPPLNRDAGAGDF